MTALAAFIAIGCALLAAWAVWRWAPWNGRRGDAPPTPRPRWLPDQLQALDAALAAREAQTPGITPGTEQHIVWGPLGHRRAHWAVVYLHGFSATCFETAPLADEVAAGLNGHVFYTRLTGHGQDGAALARATVADWKADTLEALHIGCLLGERVLVMGTSTGATLATWLAARPECQGRVHAWVFISPNFGIRNRLSELINWPWGTALALRVIGPERQTNPPNADAARYWTTRYPTQALFPMMAMLARVRRGALKAVKAPLLMFYSERDTVVHPAAVRSAFKQAGSADKQLIAVTNSDSVGQHVLAGRILSPASTATLRDAVLAFVRQRYP